MLIDRRKLLTGLIAAPLVVPVNRLMKLQGAVLRPNELCTFSCWTRVDGGEWEFITRQVEVENGLIQVPLGLYHGLAVSHELRSVQIETNVPLGSRTGEPVRVQLMY